MVGHVLESCPVNHGLTYTDCQMFQMKQTNASSRKKPTSPGIEQLSSKFQELAKDTNPPASLTHPTLNVENIKTTPGPDTMVEQIIPPAQTDTPKTVQSDQTNTAKRLLFSLGIPTKPDTARMDPSGEIPKKVPCQRHKNTKTGGKRNRERKTNQNY